MPSAVKEKVVDTEMRNRPDEWKIEQGLAGAKLPFLDQTGDTTTEIAPCTFRVFSKNEAIVKAVGNPDKLFVQARPGWRGSVLLHSSDVILC